MLSSFILLLELMSVLVCMHSIFDEKLKPDMVTIVFCLCDLIALEFINFYQLEHEYTLVVYGMYLIYCIVKFKAPISQTILNLLICMILLIILQFICTLGVFFFPIKTDITMALFVNAMTLWISIILLPRLSLHHFAEMVYRKNLFLYAALGFVFLIIGVMVFQSKVWGGIQAEMFLFAIPAILLLLAAIQKWLNNLIKSNELEQELRVKKSFDKSYQELLTKVRIRQHDFNNQITAILGTHYVYNTYEDMVEMQEKYGRELMDGNKYNKLLWLGNQIIAGFLYRKFQELETDGIKIEYSMAIRCFHSDIQDHYLVEILGILLGNAAEASADRTAEKIIRFHALEVDNGYLFKISNRAPYLSYDTLEAWFELGRSSKGKERGIGLYRVKQLCNTLGCSVYGKNTEDCGENWIELVLNVKKAGDSIS